MKITESQIKRNFKKAFVEAGGDVDEFVNRTIGALIQDLTADQKKSHSLLDSFNSLPDCEDKKNTVDKLERKIGVTVQAIDALDDLLRGC